MEARTALRIAPRGSTLEIAADPTLERPYQLSWRGAEPRVRESDDRIEVDYTTAARLRALSPRGGSLALTLNPAVAWSIELRGGVSGLRADLRGLQVSEVAIAGGASDVVVDLPRPRGQLELRVAGGVSKAVVRRPADVPVVVEIDGGARDLRIDDERLGAVGGSLRKRTHGEASDDGELGIRILGGASRLSVDVQKG